MADMTTLQRVLNKRAYDKVKKALPEIVGAITGLLQQHFPGVKYPENRIRLRFWARPTKGGEPIFVDTGLQTLLQALKGAADSEYSTEIRDAVAEAEAERVMAKFDDLDSELDGLRAEFEELARGQ